jgi:hypothetical protein
MSDSSNDLGQAIPLFACACIIYLAPVVLFGGGFRLLKKLETRNWKGASLESLTEKSTSRCFFKGVSSCKAAAANRLQQPFFLKIRPACALISA